MDKKFINENKFNEAIDRFQELAGYKYPKQSLKHLYEYTVLSHPQIDEVGEDDGELQQPQNGGMGQQQPPQQGNMGNGQMQEPDMGAGMPQDGSQMPQDAGMQGNGMDMSTGSQMPPDQSGMPQDGNMQGGGDMGMMGDEQMDDGGDMQGPDMGSEEEPMGGPMEYDGIETTEMEPDDEVIDVDDLTQSQQATEYKIDGVDDRLSKIYSVVKKFSDQLEKQEKSIMKLKDEFEKRNPTQTEKFNLRSQASGPFNQTPSDYWDKFSDENPNYEIIRDNDVSPNDEQKEYKIKRGDISGLNMKNISDTLNLNQNLKDYIGF